MNHSVSVPDSSPVLSLKNVVKTYGDFTAVDGISLSIPKGSIYGFLGPNGSGKTTLMRILCGLNDSYEGSIYWHGEKIERQTESFFASLLYIGHRAGVSKVLTPIENLRWSCSLKQQIDDEQILSALAEVGLRGFEESPCYTLSAGQQQRVSLARLLASPAQLWVLDEPFTTLDRTGVALLEKMLQTQAASGGAVLVTTHHKLDIPALNILSLG